jgi:arylsulfatase A-like enzyme
MGLRGDAIVQFDWSVGEIVKALEKAGIRENTLIIVTSDNGPVVDDGYADQAVEKLKNHKPWGPFRGGKYSAYEAGTRVPFIVNWQGKTQAKESAALVSQIDMLATLARLVGVDISEKEVADSRDQLDAWLGHDEKGRDYVIGAASTLTVLTRHWKYIEPNDGPLTIPSPTPSWGTIRRISFTTWCTTGASTTMLPPAIRWLCVS